MRLSTLLALTAHSKDTTPAMTKTTVHGLPVTIEHAKGTIRKLHDSTGKVVYQKHMMHHYGFFDKTKGRDGDEVDCFVGPMGDKATEVYIVHMKDLGPVPSEREDEDKCFVGFSSADAAKTAFLAHYPTSFFGGMTTLPVADFKQKMATASLPYRKKKITADKKVHCPHCGSTAYGLMPTDFETARCRGCGKTFNPPASSLPRPSNTRNTIAQGKLQLPRALFTTNRVQRLLTRPAAKGRNA